jgi:hypothetical protein
MEPPKKKQGRTARPAVDIDEELLMKLFSIGCTVHEAAYVVGVSPQTLYNHYGKEGVSEMQQQGLAQVRVGLRRKQIEVAMTGDKTMLIWLGKQLLNQTDLRPMEPPTPPQDTVILTEEGLREVLIAHGADPIMAAKTAREVTSS